MRGTEANTNKSKTNTHTNDATQTTTNNSNIHTTQINKNKPKDKHIISRSIPKQAIKVLVIKSKLFNLLSFNHFDLISKEQSACVFASA